MDRETELTLVARLRQGEADAFDEVYAAFNKPLFTFLIRLSRRRDVAEDLHEETWLRLVKHAGRLAPTRGWGPGSSRSRATFTSATGVRGRWKIRPRRPHGVVALSARETSPFEETAANELERRIERALANLPAASREVLLLVGVAGLDQSDVADICGITPARFDSVCIGHASCSRTPWSATRPAARSGRSTVMSEPLIRRLGELPAAEPDTARSRTHQNALPRAPGAPRAGSAHVSSRRRPVCERRPGE